MPDQTTIREHLEEIRDAYPPIIGNHGRTAYEHAKAALDLLDNSSKCSLSIEGQVHLPCRAVYDPDPAPRGDDA